MPNNGPMKRRKIAVLGARSVGKSSMIVQFTEGHFVDSYYPTIESVFTKTVGYNGTDYDCEIIDTAGQDEFSLLGPKHTIGIHGFVLVYSVASRKSFDMIQVIYDKIIDFCGLMDIPCVIVGAKMDLQTSSRQVEKTEGQRLAEMKRAAYTETSAKKNANIALVFELCLAEIERHSPTSNQQPADEKRPCVIM